MTLTCRPYRNEYDYFKIREFLCQTLLLHERRQINWPLYRWDYWRWHVNANLLHFKLNETIFLWETEDGALAAVLNPGGRSEGFLQIHPRYRTPGLIHEMLALAEQKFAAPGQAGQMTLGIGAHANDEVLKAALTRRGYSPTGEVEYQRWQALDQPLPTVPVKTGFTLRSLGTDIEFPARSWASWRAFHPNEPDENYAGWEWYRNIQRIPIYRHDLDLTVIAPDGKIAAFATLWYDETTKTGAFEPVGTVPEYQRQGLAKALMAEGLQRLQKLGAVVAYVSSYEPAAHATYASAGFGQYDLSTMWIKTWRQG